jgi:hypothetical protein
MRCDQGPRIGPEHVVQPIWERESFGLKPVSAVLENSHPSLIVGRSPTRGAVADGSHKTNALPFPGVLSTSI